MFNSFAALQRSTILFKFQLFSWIKIIKINMIINNTPQFVHIKTQDLNDRLDLAFLKKENGRFVYGIGCFVKDRLSY